MSSTAARLRAEKQRVIRESVLAAVGGEVSVSEEQLDLIARRLLPELHLRGYAVQMRGGDRVWGEGEDPPGAEEISGGPAWEGLTVPLEVGSVGYGHALREYSAVPCPPIRRPPGTYVQVVTPPWREGEEVEALRRYAEQLERSRDATSELIAHLTNQLRNSEIFRRNSIHARREAEAKLAAYRTEVRDMRLAIVTLLEVWDAMSDLEKSGRRSEILESRIEALREGWGYDIVREDADGAPFPDQPRDWRAALDECPNCEVAVHPEELGCGECGWRR